MTQALGIHEINRSQGRALYIDRDGQFYVARQYAVYRSDDDGKTWRLDCRVPCSVWKSYAARSRLAARLLRHYIAAFQVLADGSRIAVARDGVYRAAPGEARMSQVFQLTRGSRPLNLAVDGARVIFGEYGDGYQSSEVFIYVSEDYGRSFHVGYRFPKGDIRHVHNVLADPYQDQYWVFVGDFGRQPGIGVLSKDMKYLNWISRGTQQCRAVGAVIEKDSLVYGTDSDRQRNFIMRLDRSSGRIEKLCEIEGSSLYAARFGPVRVISTCVEPNPACPSRECSLYASLDGDSWQRMAVHKKDRYHSLYLQFGTLVLPYSYHGGRKAMYSGQAVEGMDRRVAMIDFHESESSLSKLITNRQGVTDGG